MASEMHGCKVRNPSSDDIEGKWRAKQLAMPQPGAAASQLHQELGAHNGVASAAKWTRHYPGLNRTQQATSHLQTSKQEKIELQGSSECQQHNEKHVQQDHGAHHRGWPSKGVQINLLAHGGLALRAGPSQVHLERLRLASVMAKFFSRLFPTAATSSTESMAAFQAACKAGAGKPAGGRLPRTSARTSCSSGASPAIHASAAGGSSSREAA